MSRYESRTVFRNIQDTCRRVSRHNEVFFTIAIADVNIFISFYKVTNIEIIHVCLLAIISYNSFRSDFKVSKQIGNLPLLIA